MRRPFNAIMKWRDATRFDPAELQKIPFDSGQIINAESLDISKRVVAGMFAETFGYPLEVNPLEFHGEIVEKSDENATHDGRVIQGPLALENIRADRVYQKTIHSISDGLALDYRLPVMGGQIPLVYLKYRPVENRFSNTNLSVKLAEPAAVFSPAELKRIIAFAQAMHLDFGELDVLRDTDDRIYVVDVSNTPSGPPNGLPAGESKSAITLLAAAFLKFLRQWHIKPPAFRRSF